MCTDFWGRYLPRLGTPFVRLVGVPPIQRTSGAKVFQIPQIFIFLIEICFSRFVRVYVITRLCDVCNLLGV